MQETIFKMASIRAGDVVVYRNARDTLSRAVVEGWKTAYDQRLLLLNNDTHIRVEQVVERQRPGGCGGTIKFESEMSA